MTFGVNGIVIKGNKILLIKREDLKIWALPGGLVEFDETLEEALGREIKEETNLEAIPQEMTGIYLRTIPYFEDVLVAYKCVVKKSKIKLGRESLDANWFTKEQALKKVPGFVEVIIKDAYKNNKRPALKKLNNYGIDIIIKFLYKKITKRLSIFEGLRHSG